MRCEIISRWVKVGNRNEMQAAQDYPADWTDVTGQRDEYILRGANQLIVFGQVTQQQLSAIQVDNQYVVLWNAADDADPPMLAPEDVDALQAKIATVYAPDVAKLVTLEQNIASAITDQLKDASRRPPFAAGISVNIGDVVQYNGNLYEAIQAHTTQADWMPPVAKALWKRYYEPSDDPWLWVQPQGAHDAYPIGTRVLFEGEVWVNTISANVWQPGVTGWQRENEPPPTQDWKAGVAYKVGDVVLYQGAEYQCLQAHTSQAGWTPSAVPALWKQL